MPARDATTLDAYVIETLLRDLVGHDGRASAFLVYLYLWAQCANATGSATLSYARIADDTGLSARAVQSSVRHLLKRKLLSCTRPTSTSTTTYRVLRPWVRR